MYIKYYLLYSPTVSSQSKATLRGLCTCWAASFLHVCPKDLNHHHGYTSASAHGRDDFLNGMMPCMVSYCLRDDVLNKTNNYAHHKLLKHEIMKMQLNKYFLNLNLVFGIIL